MNRTVKFIYFMVIAITMGGINALAVGTPAGTDISNTANISYDVGSVTGLTASSNTETVTVAEILDVTVTSLDASALQVNPGDVDRVRTFQVDNIGNGNETFELSVSSTLSGDDFNPTGPMIYIDNGDGSYVPSDDPQYVSGVNDPNINADGFVIIHVLNSIPTTNGANPLNEGDTGDTQLIATSLLAINDPAVTPGLSPAGTQITSPSLNEGDLGTEAIIGNSQGQADALGTYVISSVEIDVRKSVAMTNPFTGAATTVAMPGGTMNYTIEVEVTSGTGTASNVVFTDVIPGNTTYADDTLYLDKNDGSGLVQLTDAISADDEGDVGQTTANTVTVDLGNLSASNGIQTITFAVTIN